MQTIGIVAAACLNLYALPACPPSPSDMEEAYWVQTDKSWAIVAALPGKVIDSKVGSGGGEGGDDDDGGIASGGPDTFGQWSAPIAFPVVAIHAAVLHTGEVLAYAYPGANQAKVWNPTTGIFTAVNMADDIFCSGHTHLSDGRIYVAGGNASGCEYKGIADTNMFHPATKTWTTQPNMSNGRWYPTALTIPDGRVLIFSGLNIACAYNTTCELFTPAGGGGPGTLSLVPEGQRQLDLYPRMHVLSNGKIAHVGPENSAWTFQLGVGWQHVDNTNFGWRSQGTSVLLPGFTDRIMVIGGGNPVTNTCEIINFGQPSPQFVNTASMTHARGHANATILPDKRVFVVGGGQNGLYGSPVLTPEMFNPATSTWTLLPSHVHSRMYHSTSLLLPDGRVLVAGQDNGPGANTAELYSPPYLFRGPRPVVTSTCNKAAYGQAFTINTPDAEDVVSVVLVKLGVVTHSVNWGQRLLTLSFAGDGAGSLIATAPASANHAPPGYYMLFVLNGSEVPSIAAMVQLGAKPTGDTDGSGVTNVDDLLAVIGGWGPCPAPCAEDVDHNGVVNVVDLLLVIADWG